MKVSTLRAALGSALVLLSHQHCHASAVHRHTHRQFHRSPDHNHARELRNHGVDAKLEKRGTCAFPAGMDANLVKVTPNAANAGWAMSPDQVCSPGYCPYACAPGMLMAQWKPGTSYTYPESMVGLDVALVPRLIANRVRTVDCSATLMDRSPSLFRMSLSAFPAPGPSLP